MPWPRTCPGRVLDERCVRENILGFGPLPAAAHDFLPGRMVTSLPVTHPIAASEDGHVLRARSYPRVLTPTPRGGRTERDRNLSQHTQPRQNGAGSDLRPDPEACSLGSLAFHTEPGRRHLFEHLTWGHRFDETHDLTPNSHPSPARTKTECIFKFRKTLRTG